MSMLLHFDDTYFAFNESLKFLSILYAINIF